MRGRIAAGAVAALAFGAVSAQADDADLVRAYNGPFQIAQSASSGIGSAEGTQRAYDAARDLQEALRRAAPVSRSCRALLSGLSRYAGARILQAEGVDRPSAGDVATGRSRAEAARSAISRVRSACAGRGGGGGSTRSPVISPSSGEVFFGTVVARAPVGATQATLYDGSTRAGSARVRGGKVRFKVPWRPGRRDVKVVFSAGSSARGSVTAKGAWLLPPSAQAGRPGDRADSSLARSLQSALSGGPRHRAAWVQGVRSGRVAGVNADAVFPAASTVKLGLLAGVLARSGARPEDSPHAYDMRAMASWSSNLASNRLVRRLGNGIATDGLRRLGARSSTFTGEYIIGTELQPRLPSGGVISPPPRTSQRVTTARDLGRMLLAVHASAVSANARKHTGLTQHQARLMLGWLLDSQQRADNAGLFAGAAGGAPIAQKNGWLRSARLGAGIIYASSGPVIAVIATFDESGVPLSRAQSTGARVARVALGAN